MFTKEFLRDNNSLLSVGFNRLQQLDPTLDKILSNESIRQASSLSLVASYSSAISEVLASTSTVLNNVTAEGYPGNRFHAGCQFVDEIEMLAIERAKMVFAARYANVQPLSGSAANLAVMFALIEPGDKIMGLSLDAGGHLTHGSRVSFSGQFYQPITYELDDNYLLDYDNILAIAEAHKPQLIICGASAYPRKISFSKFRSIADEVGALLLADISHIAGLVAAGLHESPIDYAHVVTSSTYKQLYGPRGGLILCGKDSDKKLSKGLTIEQSINKAVFPGIQGTPQPSSIAGKAAAFQFIMSPSFKIIAHNIIKFAHKIAVYFIKQGYKVISNGTDNHIVMLDTLESLGMTGYVAEKSLEECGIIVNKNKMPKDLKSPFITSGIRIGTNDLALRNLSDENISEICSLVVRILKSVQVINDKEYHLNSELVIAYKKAVINFCYRHPICIYST